MVPMEVGGMGRPNRALIISRAERSQLRSIVRSRSLPHSLARRGQIVLLSADGPLTERSPGVAELVPRWSVCGASVITDAASPGCTRNFVRAGRAAIATHR
jgi:hypothetical protein